MSAGGLTSRLARAGVVIALVLGVFSAPPAFGGEQTKRPFKIGILHRGYFPNNPSVEGLKAGLKAAGLEEGRDVAFDVRFTKGSLEEAPAAVAALANAGVSLIFVDSEGAARAARAATQTIPIVFTQVGDPVAVGIVREIAHPGGNVTGVSNLATELVPKRLEVLKAIVPGLRRVWAVYHADEVSSLAAVRRAHEVVPILKLDLVARPVRTQEELVRTLKALRPGDGVLSPAARTLNIPGLVLDLTLFSRVPAVFDSALWVQAGGLVSYGSEEKGDALQAARLVAKILRGARPQDLPVEGANRIELAVNLKTAKALGVTVPREIGARADLVIE